MDKEYLGYEDYYDVLEMVDQPKRFHFPDGKKSLEKAKDLAGYEIIVNRCFMTIDEFEHKLKEDLEVSTVSLVVKYYKWVKEYIDDNQQIFYVDLGPVELADLK